MRGRFAIASVLAIVLCQACSEPAQPPAQKQQAAAAVPAASAAPLRVEPLQFTERTLPNGLRVFSMPNRSTGNVAVQVWYDVGSKDDPAGRSGFAHLFEHIMFKATRNMPAETIDRLTEDVGGQNNASTWDDFTDYYEVVPANHLQRVLWAEAERMGALVVDKATFASERDVVKEEYRQRVLASPYGKLFGLYLSQANFSVHPYGRPTIGSIEDLDAATIDDVRAFHAAYYRPDNAVLVVSGNFDQAQLDKWVDQYFGPIPSPKRPIPRVTVKEPVRTSPREYTVYEPNTPLPAVTVSYPSPEARSPDMPALMVLDAILSKGDSSRLYQSLVYTQRLAAQVETSLEATKDPGAYSVLLILSEGKSADDGIKGIMGEIAKMRDAPVTAAELDEAKNELLSDALEERETALGRASVLAESVIRYGDPAYADKLLARIQATTAAGVQRVAQKLFDDKQRVVIRYLPEESRPANAKGDTIKSAATIRAERLNVPAADIPTVALAPVATRAKPPAPGPAVAAQFPKPSERTLANGLRVIVAPKRDLPLISAELRVLSGSSNDPRTGAGTASLAADLVTKGTKTRSATDIARQIESLGASLSTGAGADSSTVSVGTLADRAGQAMAIAADVVRNPVFAPEELERQRQQTLDGLSVALRQPASIARYAMARVLFGDGPYGSVASPKSVSAIKRDDVAGFHSTYWRPDNAVLVITGDVSPEDGFKLAQDAFGDWAKPSSPVPAEPDGGAASPRRAVFVDLPKSGQAVVAVGLHGPARTSADYFPTLVANSVLGGGYSARLNQEIRIKRGLSYGANSSFPQRREPGPIVASAQTRNDAAAQVAGLMNGELTRLGQAPVGPDELAARQASLIGSFGRDVETTSGLADQLTQLASFGIPPERLQSYVPDVSAVTGDQVKAVAARVYDPQKASLLVVGDGAVAFDALKKNRADLERIPIGQLNLDSPTLK